MTRKDYVAIARGLRVAYDSVQVIYKPHEQPERSSVINGILAAADAIAEELVADNPRFDREHFLAVVRGEKDLNSRPARKAEHVSQLPEKIADDGSIAMTTLARKGVQP